MKLEDFDELFVGDPVEIEQKLRSLLPEAKNKNPSVYLQILSQIALAEVMQKRFQEAQQTLDEAESLLTIDDELARVRILIERGRLEWQVGRVESARPYFEQAIEVSTTYGFDFHSCNATHLLAIVGENADDKIRWNQKAIQLAEASQDFKCRGWLGALYHNLVQAYLEAGRYEEALTACEKTLLHREQEGYVPNVRVAKWSIACCLRRLGRIDEASTILNALLEEYEAMATSGKSDLPLETLRSTRGLVYEELAEIHHHKAKQFARLAYDDLSHDEWFQKAFGSRLEKVKTLGYPNL